MSKKELSEGLQNLLSDVIGIETDSAVTRLEITRLSPNRSQPRVNFDDEEMKAMKESIRENGILQPILVRPVSNGYEIIAGERRWRAARELGLRDIPVIIKKIDNEKMLLLSLIENIQREDLNPMEKAMAYDKLVKTLNLTQEEAARRLSIDRSSLANTIRLLELPEDIQGLVSRGIIPMGHARTLLGIKDAVLQKKICGRIINEGLSVRQVESMVAELKNNRPETARSGRVKKKTNLILDIEDRLRKSLKTKVSLTKNNGKGRLLIEFYNDKQLEGILNLLGVTI